jgi:hypothetical protein
MRGPGLEEMSRDLRRARARHAMDQLGGARVQLHSPRRGQIVMDRLGEQPVREHVPSRPRLDEDSVIDERGQLAGERYLFDFAQRR